MTRFFFNNGFFFQSMLKFYYFEKKINLIRRCLLTLDTKNICPSDLNCPSDPNNSQRLGVFLSFVSSFDIISKYFTCELALAALNLETSKLSTLPRWKKKKKVFNRFYFLKAIFKATVFVCLMCCCFFIKAIKLIFFLKISRFNPNLSW